MLACMYVCVAHACFGLKRPEKDVASPGTGVTDGVNRCVDAGNQTQVLWESSGRSSPLDHLPSPFDSF